MENVIEQNDIEEMEHIADELFSVIPGIENAIPVPQINVSKLTKQEFKENWVSKNKPLLIKGAIKHWPAIQKWKDKEHWKVTCKNDETNIITHMNFYSWDRKNKDQEKLPFHDAIERLFQDKDHIFSIPSQVVDNQNLYAGLLNDQDGFSFLSPGPPPLWDKPKGLFIYRRASTAWHVHNCDETLMCQVKGTKKVALLPSTMPGAKQVTKYLEDEQYLDGKELEKKLDLQPHIAMVEEGDTLYIPPHWFHCVVPADGEIGFTSLTVFRSPWHIYGNFSNFFVRRLYSMVIKESSFGIKMIVPFWGLYAWIRFVLRKLTGKTIPAKG